MIHEGMRVEDILSTLNYRHRNSAIAWIRARGFNVQDGQVVRMKSTAEIEDEIARRVAARPNPTPCWRCGARECGHR